MHEALHRHTHPTHLFLPDKVLFGLNVRQIIFLLVGSTLAYWLWLRLGVVIPSSWGGVGIGVRIVAALLPFVLCLVAAFASIAARPLELWGMIALQFASQPKRAGWRAAHQTTATGRPSSRYASVQSLLPIRHILYDVIEVGAPRVRVPEHYAAIIEVRAANVALLSPDEQHRLFAGFRAFLSALRFPVQILMRCRRIDLSRYAQRLAEVMRETPSSGVETDPLGKPLPSRRRLANSHLEAIAVLEREQLLLERRLYLVVCSPREESHSPLARIFPPSKRAAHTELTQARRDLDLRVASLLDLLAEMGLEGIRLAGEDLLTLLDQSLRGESARRTPLTLAHLVHSLPGATSSLSRTEHASSEEALFSVPPREEDDEEEGEEEEIEDEVDLHIPSVLDQLAPSALLISSNHLRVGEDYLAGSAVVGLPREVSEGVLLPLLALDEQMDISLHLRPLATPNVLRRLIREQAQYRATERISKQRGMLSDPDVAVAKDDTEWLIPQLASGQERLLEVGITIMARAESELSVHVSQQRIESTLHNGLLSAHPTTLEQFETYGATLPIGRANTSRSFITTSSALSALLPFSSTSLMQPEGIFVGLTGSAEPVLLDPWGPSMDNPHEFWGGISGSGKSFAIKLRIMHELLIRPELQVVIIDPAGEYRTVTEAMGGHHIRIAPGSTQSINPFDLVPAGLDLSRYVQLQQGDRLAEKIQNLHSFLDILLTDYTPTPGTLTSEEKGLLDTVLYEVYERAGITADPWTHGRPAPLLQDVALVLRKSKKDKNSLRLAQRLQRFITGSMAGLFSRPTNVALTAPVLDFDLREMRGGSEIKPAGIFLISEFLWTQALYHPKPRRCYIDEAWSLIEHQEGGTFLERMAREFRKHAVSLVTITQNPEKFVTDPRGSVIAQNAFTKVLKRLDSIGAGAASATFGLTPAEEQRLTHLDRKKALLLVGSKRLIVEINASPEEYELAQTDPQAHKDMAPRFAAVSVTQEEQVSPAFINEQGEEHLPASTSAVPLKDKRAGRTRIRRLYKAPNVGASSQVVELEGQKEQREDEVAHTDPQEQVAPLSVAVPTMKEERVSPVSFNEQGEEHLPAAANALSVVPLKGKHAARTRSRRSKTVIVDAPLASEREVQTDQHTSTEQDITVSKPRGLR